MRYTISCNALSDEYRDARRLLNALGGAKCISQCSMLMIRSPVGASDNSPHPAGRITWFSAVTA
eukprot:8956721-Pyramimonas_sp.AAC.1